MSRDMRPAPAASGHRAYQAQGEIHSSTIGDPVQRLLARLDKVRANGKDRWMACCPAHDDRSPSLSVRETPDGTVLLRCFAGCTAGEVMTAVGLQLRDLFPWRPEIRPRTYQGLPPWKRRKLMEAYRFEEIVIRCFAGKLEHGERPTEQDCERLALAWDRRRKIARKLGLRRHNG